MNRIAVRALMNLMLLWALVPTGPARAATFQQVKEFMAKTRACTVALANVYTSPGARKVLQLNPHWHGLDCFLDGVQARGTINERTGCFFVTYDVETATYETSRTQHASARPCATGGIAEILRQGREDWGIFDYLIHHYQLDSGLSSEKVVVYSEIPDFDREFALGKAALPIRKIVDSLYRRHEKTIASLSKPPKTAQAAQVKNSSAKWLSTIASIEKALAEKHVEQSTYGTYILGKLHQQFADWLESHPPRRGKDAVALEVTIAEKQLELRIKAAQLYERSLAAEVPAPPYTKLVEELLPRLREKITKTALANSRAAPICQPPMSIDDECESTLRGTASLRIFVDHLITAPITAH